MSPFTPPAGRMRIGELSELTRVSVRSIRYYEQQGLLTSERTSSGQRTYAQPAIERIRLIQRLFAAGLSSVTMADLLPCITDTAARTPLLTDRLNQERDRILAHSRELQRTARTLQTVIEELR